MSRRANSTRVGLPLCSSVSYGVKNFRLAGSRQQNSEAVDAFLHRLKEPPNKYWIAANRGAQMLAFTRTGGSAPHLYLSSRSIFAARMKSDSVSPFTAWVQIVISTLPHVSTISGWC